MSAATLTDVSVTVPVGELVERLTAASRVAATMGPGVPGVRWTFGAGQLAIEAVGVNMAIRTTIPVLDDAEGSFVLPAKTILNLARSLPAVTATFTVGDGSTVNVSSGAVSCDLRAMTALGVAEMPSAPDDAPVARLAADELRAVIGLVERSISRDPKGRPVIGGARVRLDADQLVMTGTDAYRVAIKRHKLGESTGVGFEAIVPLFTLAELAKFAAGDLDLSVGSDRLVATAEGTTIVSRLIDGQFPNVEQLFAEALPLEARVSTSELGAALRRMAVAGAPQVRLTFSDGELEVSARSDEFGVLAEVLPASWTGGEPLEMAFILELLRDGVDAIDSGATRLLVKEPLRPLRLLADDDESFDYLVMPQRVI